MCLVRLREGRVGVEELSKVKLKATSRQVRVLAGTLVVLLLKPLEPVGGEGSQKCS